MPRRSFTGRSLRGIKISNIRRNAASIGERRGGFVSAVTRQAEVGCKIRCALVAYTAITLCSRGVRYNCAVSSLSYCTNTQQASASRRGLLFPTSSADQRPGSYSNWPPRPSLSLSLSRSLFGCSAGYDRIRGGAAASSQNRLSRMAAASSDASTATAEKEEEGAAKCGKLEALRRRMKELGLDAYIVPSDVLHLSEYVPSCYERRAYISGFGGSAGTAVVTLQKAFLWTDGRYFNQASQELDPKHWTLMKQDQPKVPTMLEFLSASAAKKHAGLSRPFKVGMDPFVSSAAFAQELADAFQNPRAADQQSPIGLIDTLDGHGNLIDAVWGDRRPPAPASPFRVHPLQYAGRTVAQKVALVREAMAEKGATMSVFSALDDIAYLFNLRATGDIDTCPVGIAYATVESLAADKATGRVTIFCDDAKLADTAVVAHLHEANVTRKPYSSITSHMQAHVDAHPDHKVWIDKSRTNYALARTVPSPQLIDAQNPITPMKALKNKAELQGMRLAHLKDAVAMARFIAWLTQTLTVQRKTVTEVEIDRVLTAFRSEHDGFLELSFPTIAGVGSNGAIIHYQAKEDTDLLQHLDTTQPILIDSGGQYTCGTTDVTRTWHFGTATPSFTEYYTRVLKGNIAVDTMLFPENTPGFVLDVFARKALWDIGKDYGHGTGHGVGAALNVHEGPMSISPRWGNTETLKKGMIVSNEPGYYEDGVCGIRIENLLSITYVNDDDNLAYDQNLKEGDEGYPTLPSGQKRFLKFEKLTMIPIQKNLIMTHLMTDEELDWLDNYHQEVFQAVSPLLKEGTPEMLWLTEACAKIDRG